MFLMARTDHLLYHIDNVRDELRVSARFAPVTDLVINVCQLLRQDLQELVDTMGEVEPWDEG